MVGVGGRGFGNAGRLWWWRRWEQRVRAQWYEYPKPRRESRGLSLSPFSHVLYAGCVAQKACEDFTHGVEAANRVRDDSS